MKLNEVLVERSKMKGVSLSISPYAFDINPSYKAKRLRNVSFRLFARDWYEKVQMTRVATALKKSGMFKLKKRRNAPGKTMWEFKPK